MNCKRLKKILHAFLYPHGAIFILLVPLSIVMLVYSLTVLQEKQGVFNYISYVLSAYTLTALCFKTPHLIRFWERVRSENSYIRRWLEDAPLRVKISLYSSLGINTAYALFQLWLGIWHRTFWYYTLAGYYLLLALMRFFLLRDVRTYNTPGEDRASEWRRYRFCGIVLLYMNLALSLIVFFIAYRGHGFTHHYITTIALAAYTFGSLATAIVGAVRYRRYNSPLYSAAKAINLAVAAVSMLTLETAMINAFGEESGETFRQMMTGFTGGAVCVFVLVVAIYMICRSNQELKSERGAN